MSSQKTLLPCLEIMQGRKAPTLLTQQTADGTASNSGSWTRTTRIWRQILSRIAQMMRTSYVDEASPTPSAGVILNPP